MVMRDMNRQMKTIGLIIYPPNKLTFVCDGKIDYLYENLPYGSSVRLKIESLGVYFVKKYLPIAL